MSIVHPNRAMVFLNVGKKSRYSMYIIKYLLVCVPYYNKYFIIKGSAYREIYGGFVIYYG